MLIYFKCPLDNLKKSLAHPGPVLRHRDTKTWSYQNCPFGLRTILAFCLMQGASAKTLTENNENTLGWVFTICFCIYGLVLVTRLLVKGCRALCNFVAVHRPTQSLVYCVAWGLCYLVLCGCFVPEVLTNDSCNAAFLCCWFLSAVTSTQFWKSDATFHKKILQCRFVKRRRIKWCRGAWKFHERGQCRSPVLCIHVKWHKPHDTFHTCNASAFSWQHELRGGAGGGGSSTTRRKRNERALLHGLQELLQSFSDEPPEETFYNKSAPHAKEPSTLLNALRTLVQRAEDNPQDLLSRLKELVAAASAGRLQESHDDDNANLVSRHSSYRQSPKQNNVDVKHASPSQRTWAQVAADSAGQKPRSQPVDKKAATSKPKNAKSKPEDFRLWIDPNDKSNVTTVHQIRKTLEQGQQITAKLCAANYETATELRTLAKAHDLNTTAETAIVIMYGEAPDDAETAWIRVQSRGSGAELRKYPVVPLGDKLPDLTNCHAKKVNFPTEEHDITCLRVTIPFCFSEISWRQCQAKPANVVAGLLQDNGLQDGFITSYGWRTLESQQWSDFAEAVTGFIKVDSKITEATLTLSGCHGVFFEHLAKNRPNNVINWITQHKDESDEQYLERVKDTEHANGITYRRQGKSRLGLRNPVGALQPSETRSRVWEARGISPKWSTGTISSWLTTNGWSDVELLAQPSRTRGWLFRAKNEASSFCFAFENDTGDYVTISQFFHAARKPTQRPIRAAGSSLNQGNLWTFTNGPKGAKPSPVPIDITQSQGGQVAPTQLDADAMEEDKGEDDATMAETKRTSAQANSSGDSPDKKRAKSCNSLTDFEGFPFCDLGGEGDCAFRALAVAYAFDQKRDETEAINASKQLGANLRAQVTSHIKKYEHFKRDWKADPRWTEKLEGGPIPATYDQWVESTARSGRWIDGPGLSTAATKLCRNIAIWKWQNNNGNEAWIKQVVISPIPGHASNIQQANSHPPLPLFLKAGHYFTVKPGKSALPMRWHEDPANTQWDAGSNRGGAKSFKSWLPPSSSCSAKSHVVSAKSQKRGKEPSHRSWLPGSSTVQTLHTIKAHVKSHKDETRSTATKSFKSWLPPTSLSNAKGTAKVSSAQKAVDLQAKRPFGPPPPKPGERPFAYQPGVPRIGRPPAKVKSKKLDRKNAMQQLRRKHAVWNCPECHLKIEGRYGSVMSSRLAHWKSRHPEKPVSMIMKPAVETFHVSYNLPKDQQDWACPLCPAALPSLPPQDRKRAIKRHCEDCHPDKTVVELRHLLNKTVRKPRVSQIQTAHWEKCRKKKFRTHDIVRVSCPERATNAKGEYTRQNCEHYCRKCLSKLGKNPESVETCAKRMKKFKDNSHTRCMRRRWWIRLKDKEPQHAANFAKAVQMTFSEIDKFFQIPV